MHGSITTTPIEGVDVELSRGQITLCAMPLKRHDLEETAVATDFPCISYMETVPHRRRPEADFQEEAFSSPIYARLAGPVEGKFLAIRPTRNPGETPQEVPLEMSDFVDQKVIGSTPEAISRRDFIKGVIVGGVAVSSAGYLFRASTLLAQSGVAGARLLTINVNGQQRRADVMKQETLAWTLRHKLGLTGTKLGCDRAECGSCTVLIDDVPYYACSVLTHTVRDRKVLTIEGLAGVDGTLHPVQQGVVDEQGFQCAFCMPGFIMASVGFLKSNPKPTRTELAQGVSGNLCRCQDYDKILTALMRGAENMRRTSHA